MKIGNGYRAFDDRFRLFIGDTDGPFVLEASTQQHQRKGARLMPRPPAPSKSHGRPNSVPMTINVLSNRLRASRSSMSAAKAISSSAATATESVDLLCEYPSRCRSRSSSYEPLRQTNALRVRSSVSPTNSVVQIRYRTIRAWQQSLDRDRTPARTHYQPIADFAQGSIVFFDLFSGLQALHARLPELGQHDHASILTGLSHKIWSLKPRGPSFRSVRYK